MSAPETTPLDHLNGIDIPTLVDLIDADPADSRTTLTAESHWRGALLTQTRLVGGSSSALRPQDPFQPTSDAPRGRLGFGTAPTPQEHLLTGLTSAWVWAYVTQAAVRGIDLEAVEVGAQAEVDIRRFLGLRDAVRPFEALVVHVTLRCDAEPALRAQLHRAVEQSCGAFLAALADDALLLTGEETGPQSNAA